MADSLPLLESRRTGLLRALANLKDMRPGSVVGAVFRCGKPTCHCARPASNILFVGSGVVEAGCKTVIGHRFKQSAMFWTVRGANAIIALRCCHLNNRIEDYWEVRRPAA